LLFCTNYSGFELYIDIVGWSIRRAFSLSKPVPVISKHIIVREAALPAITQEQKHIHNPKQVDKYALFLSDANPQNHFLKLKKNFYKLVFEGRNVTFANVSF